MEVIIKGSKSQIIKILGSINGNESPIVTNIPRIITLSGLPLVLELKAIHDLLVRALIPGGIDYGDIGMADKRIKNIIKLLKEKELKW